MTQYASNICPTPTLKQTSALLLIIPNTINITLHNHHNINQVFESYKEWCSFSYQNTTLRFIWMLWKFCSNQQNRSPITSSTAVSLVPCAVAHDCGVTVMVLQGTWPSRTVLSLSNRRCCLPKSAEVLFDNRSTEVTRLTCWLMKWGWRCQLGTGEALQCTTQHFLSIHKTCSNRSYKFIPKRVNVL